ncbi:MAG: hypothetical protein RIQ93_425 [Verrucomicrobiota bacterium]
MDYNRDIRPILAKNCFSCHGPDEKGREANLRLDLAASAYAERDGFIPLKPGDPANSEAWIRVTSANEDEVMPPPKAHSRPSDAQKRKLKAWIEQGAKYQRHWAFTAPRKTVPPGGANLAPIDGFVRARLAEEGFKPSAEADRAMLLRRLSLDLTGLPPSAEEVLAFVTDPGAGAYEQQVERLLQSDHFGERLALEWLDAARYADTNGFSIDGGRHLWLWRDWVIQAFNDNKPYNRFLLEQIAGDLLPDRTEAQLVATGFQRNNMVTHEGGTIVEENLTNYNADRVKTLGEAVLGLTLGCAQCHDHKFDPISQQEYYQLFAYFNTVSDKGLDGNGGINPAPFVQARTVLRSNEPPVLRGQIAALTAELARPDTAVLERWEQTENKRLKTRGHNLKLHPVKVLKISTPNRGAGFDIEDGTRVRLATGIPSATFDVLTEFPRITEPVTGFRVVMHPVPEMPGGGWGGGPAEPRRPARKDTAAADQNAEAAPAVKGTFILTAIAATAGSIPGPQVDLHKLLSFKRVTASSWTPANPPVGCLDPRPDDGWSPDLAATGPVHLTATFNTPVRAGATPFLTVQLNFSSGKNLVPGLIEVLAVTGNDDGTDLPAEILGAIETPSPQRTADQRAKLWDYCAKHTPELEAKRVALANLQERLATLTEPFSTMVMDMAEKPRETFILHRGDYAQPTVKVQPGTLAALPPLPAGAPANRLGLAQWITMNENPLTARVAVNRIWKMLFGAGLVTTAADFGSQGAWPTHPELLDWLAVEFMASNWDVKALVRLIVTSQTYRQTSATSPELLERDPANRLLARGPRFRLPAEFIRDSALKISGLWTPRVGGPSVNPYLPADLWREVSHYGSTPATAQTFIQDHGEKLYRRSLYTYWKRTAPPPSLTAFDAPNREVCTVDRANTTTPLQALVTLNDPQFVEAARAFAERILAHPGDDLKKLQWAFLETTAREPRPEENRVLHAALLRERRHASANPAGAKNFLRIGESPRNPQLPPVEHAAWAQVASLLLNLSETLTRN